MDCIDIIRIVYISVSFLITILYTLFAPEAAFYKPTQKENPKLFDRWSEMRLAWNLHQSFIHFVGSTVGFIALYILFFELNIQDPSKYSLVHLILFLLGIAGIMGFIPKILFGSTISK